MHSIYDIKSLGPFLKGRRRGFTLTELAFVLVIVCLLLGAIWVAGQSVWDNYRVYLANEQMAKVTQNIREYYMNAQTLPAGTLTTTLDGLGLFPVEMRRNPDAALGATVIDNPFDSSAAGGSFVVDGIACVTNAASPCFRVQMLNLTQEICIKLLTFVPANNTDLGIVQVGVQAGGTTVAMATGVASPASLFIAAGTAEGWCNQPGATNEVDWDFKLRN